MQINEAIIPSSNKGEFLLKLFNVNPPVGKRPFREHKHIEFEIVLFKSGYGTYRTMDKEYSIQPGDIFLFSSNEVHCITEIQNNMSLMNIHFEPRFIWSNGNDLFDAKYLQIFLNRSKNFENRLSRSNPYAKVIKKLLLDMEKEFHYKHVEYTLMVKVQLLTILVNLIRHFDYVKKDDNNFFIRKINFEAIERSMNYITEHLTEQLTLDALAQAASLCKTYFPAVFKKLNGISPWDYITAKRVERAMELIKGGNPCTMLEIAIQCGFNNTANFNRAFKKYSSKTPTEYKQQSQSSFF